MTARRKKPESGARYAKRTYLGGTGKPPILNYTWRRNSSGVVVEYSLTYIDFTLCSRDNGRALGYDNAHGFHERHACGHSERTTYTTYEELVERFAAEVQLLRSKL